MKKNNKKTRKGGADKAPKLLVAQRNGVLKHVVQLAKSIKTSEQSTLGAWLDLAHYVVKGDFQQSTLIAHLKKNGVAVNKGNLSKAVACAKSKKSASKFSSLQDFYDSLPKNAKASASAKSRKKNKPVAVTSRRIKSAAKRVGISNSKAVALIKALGLSA